LPGLRGGSIAALFVSRLQTADWREIPSEALERSELRQALTKTMMSLSEKYRKVMILRDVQHLSTKQTAQILDLTVEAVKTRLNRARLMIREPWLPALMDPGIGGQRMGRFDHFDSQLRSDK